MLDEGTPNTESMCGGQCEIVLHRSTGRQMTCSSVSSVRSIAYDALRMSYTSFLPLHFFLSNLGFSTLLAKIFLLYLFDAEPTLPPVTTCPSLVNNDITNNSQTDFQSIRGGLEKLKHSSTWSVGPQKGQTFEPTYTSKTKRPNCSKTYLSTFYGKPSSPMPGQ
ncbi:uncharacterized protein K460DRAFT_78929 [Cucurbitaria berberidis CBS 394.84]|uniref:Uncharacterized protein n=1 Tax=Cucurbitaria berberidis CBS 394.84 TaxID=1168544 RepID=A0A9P4GN04_9PLEO|nr:uncharacterized protein K460DRAFT_78929 [Cucurbitaria berberidis CBS 394.84]KAF1848642.1 hypothetical protein K460DRAFT_78929 [Cucurbitaria berberidis CBS 394.84]